MDVDLHSISRKIIGSCLFLFMSLVSIQHVHQSRYMVLPLLGAVVIHLLQYLQRVFSNHYFLVQLHIHLFLFFPFSEFTETRIHRDLIKK